MAGSFLSDNWYRIAPLRPQLRSHARVARQRFRGKPWYIVHDTLTNRVHRFSPRAWWLASQLDGHCSVDMAWQKAVEELGDDAPSQDEVIQLLAQLHRADLLLSDAAPEVGELLARRDKQARSKWMSGLLNPMSVRIPLWDPDRFLQKTVGWIRPLFGWFGLVLWLTIVLPAGFLAMQQWEVLTGNLADRLLSSGNLLSLVLIFPAVKFLHELGHGYAVKAHGGEVHEAGIMLLVFAPAPYVDASASTAFRSKWYRAFVAAAGMLTELLLAALAMYVWLTVEPGTVRTVAFNVMMVAGISTLVFNGNPLLRFDGYYILSDLIEIPNLAQRANSYYGWLVRRYGFADHDAPPPSATPAELRWFLFYAPAAFAFRIFTSLSIALFIANQYFFVGVLLALWSVAGMVLFPALKSLRFLFASPQLARRRSRAMAVTVAVLGGACLFVTYVPFPSHSISQGIVWVPEGAEVRAAGAGFVQRIMAAPMSAVGEQQPLLELEDPALMAKYAEQSAKVAELEVQTVIDRIEDRARAFQSQQSLDRELHALEDVERRVGELTTAAPGTGQFILAKAEDLPGRYVKRGELLGYVLGGDLRVVRAVIAQDEIGIVRGRLKAIEVRLADRLTESFSGEVLREVPQGSEALPSKALTQDGGGELAADPRDPQGLATLDKVFQLDILLSSAPQDLRIGTRAHVKFVFEPEPLYAQASRRLRQLFLSRLHV
jgi:putative peptide zinc metalloprotease protein